MALMKEGEGEDMGEVFTDYVIRNT
jgi:hypothetical protein